MAQSGRQPCFIGQPVEGRKSLNATAPQIVIHIAPEVLNAGDQAYLHLATRQLLGAIRRRRQHPVKPIS